MASEPPRMVQGSCLRCAGRFEFPEADAGKRVPCPHCGEETPLFSLSISFDLPPSPESEPVPDPTPAPKEAPPADPGLALARYLSGAAVRIGDRVRHREHFATVVFVSNGDREDFASGYEDYRGHEAGIIISDDDGETTYVRDGDPELEMLHR